MANYHASIKIISRQVKTGTGKPVAGRQNSAVAASAYRGGYKLHDERYERMQDYTAKQYGVRFSTVLTPDGAPEWMADPQVLWNAVEKKEDESKRHASAQLARELEFSLPVELTDEQNHHLALTVGAEFVKRGMVAQVSIHEPMPKGEQRNPHVHILLTMRDIRGDGFGNKNRDWNGEFTGERKPNGARVKDWRKMIADHTNAALKSAGHDARVDHRSFKDRGVDQVPTVHQGKTATAFKERGERTRRGDKQRIVTAMNAAHASERTETDASIPAQRRRHANELTWHAQRVARGAAKASRDALHDSTPGKDRGTYTKKEAIDRAGHVARIQQSRLRDQDMER